MGKSEVYYVKEVRETAEGFWLYPEKLEGHHYKPDQALFLTAPRDISVLKVWGPCRIEVTPAKAGFLLVQRI